MKTILKQILKAVSNITTLFSNFLKKLEVILEGDNLILIRTSHHSLGRNKGFILSNPQLLEAKDLFLKIYMFLMTSEEFLKFGEYKIIIVNGKIKDTTFNLHHNVLIKNETSFASY
jgi:hypothetical protein